MKQEGSTTDIAVSIVASGSRNYARAALQTVQSVLERTPFDVLLQFQNPPFSLGLHHPRVSMLAMPDLAPARPAPFMAKLTSLGFNSNLDQYRTVILLDADCLIVKDIGADEVEEALEGVSFALVEQKGIKGSAMNREAFFEHFCRYALPVISPETKTDQLGRFRYFNSGVVFAQTEDLLDLADFARQSFADRPDLHTAAGQLVADQDYFQFWLARNEGPRWRELPVSWNDSYWWNADFQNKRTRIIHFSSFTNGPSDETVLQMAGLRTLEGLQHAMVLHNSEEHLQDALTLLIHSSSFPVLVIDNASTDDSLDQAERLGAQVASFDSNMGFAKAANCLLEMAQAEFVCLVNPDCLVYSDFLDDAQNILSADPTVVGVVPAFQHPDGSLVQGLQSGYTFRRVLWEIFFPMWRADKAGPIMAWFLGLGGVDWNWPLAACAVLRREQFLEIGGFDESFFLYMEDVEIGKRAAARGLRFSQSPAIVWHYGAEGSKISPKLRQRLLTGARLHFLLKEFGSLGRFFARFLLCLRGRA